jgi:UDP-perosamine 4-acetyltransferase
MTATSLPPVIVLGAGGHAAVVIGSLTRLGRRILGLADQDPARKGSYRLGVEVCGDDAWVLSHSPDEVELALGIASVGRTAIRQKIFQRFDALGFRFATLVDPTSIVGAQVSMADGVQVMAGAVLQPSSVLGRNVIVNTRAVVEHDCRLEDHCHVAPGAVVCGGVTIGVGAHVGAGAVVIQGIHIGSNAVVGAGAVVIADVPDGMLVLGNPAREEKSLA